MSAIPKVEIRNPKSGGAQCLVGNQRGEFGVGERATFLTRYELAEVLKISVRTVDTMLAGGELPHLPLHGNFIRFYLPDVVRHLSATALVSKRRWAGPARRTTNARGAREREELGSGKAETET